MMASVVIEGNDLSGWTNHYPLYQKKIPKKIKQLLTYTTGKLTRGIS